MEIFLMKVFSIRLCVKWNSFDELAGATLADAVVKLEASLDNDQTHQLDWAFTVASGGQWDVRLIIDPTSQLDERDENNNERYLIVSGADGESGVGVVSGFGPSLLTIGLVGLAISIIQRRLR